MNSWVFMWLECCEVQYIYSQIDGADDQRSDTCRGIQLLDGHVKMLWYLYSYIVSDPFPFIHTLSICTE
jgi:hypothetical protein